MSHLAFTSRRANWLDYTRKICGAEWSNMRWLLNHCTDPEAPELRFIRRMRSEAHRGAWVRAENCAWLAGLIREACESTVEVSEPDAVFSSHREELLRIGSSWYGPADLHKRSDRLGPIQTWWSLHDWLQGHDHDVAMSYSVTGEPWPEIESWEAHQRYLRGELGAMEWTPENWGGPQ